MTWMGRWLDNGLFCNVEKQSIFPLAAFQGNTTVFYHVDLDLACIKIGQTPLRPCKKWFVDPLTQLKDPTKSFVAKRNTVGGSVLNR